MNSVISYWPNLNRAYEIALLGNKSISVYADKQDYPKAEEDLVYIKQVFSQVNYELDADIQIEITKPDNYTHIRPEEQLEDIHARVAKARQLPRPTEVHKDCEQGCKSLLKVSSERLEFSLKDVNIVWELSGIIAQAGHDEFIRTEHLAEAIHYRSYKSDKDCYLPDYSWSDVKVAEFMYDIVRTITEGTLRSWEKRHFLAVITELKEKSRNERIRTLQESHRTQAE